MYKSIYEFQVADKVKEGKSVYCCDKKRRTVSCMNIESMDFYANTIKEAAMDDSRFSFWIEEDGENA